ncbi:hypothetical protein L1887_58717 [Cichorium endivia]|nr:hypothetical protein L1887_58717 [Cichorium endivia]
MAIRGNTRGGGESGSETWPRGPPTPRSNREQLPRLVQCLEGTATLAWCQCERALIRAGCEATFSCATPGKIDPGTRPERGEMGGKKKEKKVENERIDSNPREAAGRDVSASTLTRTRDETSSFSRDPLPEPYACDVEMERDATIRIHGARSLRQTGLCCILCRHVAVASSLRLGKKKECDARLLLRVAGSAINVAAEKAEQQSSRAAEERRGEEEGVPQTGRPVKLIHVFEKFAPCIFWASLNSKRPRARIRAPQGRRPSEARRRFDDPAPTPFSPAKVN